MKDTKMTEVILFLSLIEYAPSIFVKNVLRASDIFSGRCGFKMSSYVMAANALKDEDTELWTGNSEFRNKILIIFFKIIGRLGTF